MEEKKTKLENVEEGIEIQTTDVNLKKEEENLGIGYEIGIGSEN